MDRKPLARIRSESSVTWESLIEAVEDYVETTPAGEFAERDAIRLRRAAEAILFRIGAKGADAPEDK